MGRIRGRDGGYDVAMSHDYEDQLQPADSLDDRGVEDTLDEGYSPPEKPRVAGRASTDPAEPETIDDRLRQEEPEEYVPTGDEPWSDPETADPEEVASGDRRTGRIADPGPTPSGASEQDIAAADLGVDGAGASAEEAAMHEVEDEDRA